MGIKVSVQIEKCGIHLKEKVATINVYFINRHLGIEESPFVDHLNNLSLDKEYPDCMERNINCLEFRSKHEQNELKIV